MCLVEWKASNSIEKTFGPFLRLNDEGKFTLIKLTIEKYRIYNMQGQFYLFHLFIEDLFI